jgi:hypothetical protein
MVMVVVVVVAVVMSDNGGATVPVPVPVPVVSYSPRVSKREILTCSIQIHGFMLASMTPLPHKDTYHVAILG